VEAAPAEQAYVYTCRFCGTHVSIEAPPKQVDPRVEILRLALEARANATSAASNRAAVATVRAAGSSVGCVIVGATMLPLLIPLFIFAGPALMGYWNGHYGSFPMEVGTNGSMEIDDREATLDDTMITVGVNGKLTLRRCKLKGAQIIKAASNAQVTIIDSTLEGSKGIVSGTVNNVVSIQNSTLTSGEEIVEGTNVKVDVSKNSKLVAATVAFPIDNNGEIDVDHSEVDGKIAGIEIKNNGKVKLTGSAVVKSDGTAVDLGNNGKLTVTSSRIESKTTAVHASFSLEGTLTGATLVGPRASLDVGTNARVIVAQSTLQGGKKQGVNSSIEDR
jgi:hypothetical protein